MILMKNKILFPLVAVLANLSMLCAQSVDHSRVEAAADLQRLHYPVATLQDFYKSCFQDAFGPEHLMSDAPEAYENARNYLVREGEYLHSQNLKTTGIPYYEQVGYRGNFYRVSLELIEDGIIPFDAFFLAFQHSVKTYQLPTVEAWKKEWTQVLKIADFKTLPHYKADVKTIDSLLSLGHYAYHHSRSFNEAYHPHYRLIAKEVFERELLPYLITDVPYEICHNYFVHNDVNEVPTCIYTQEEFSRCFGMAAFMGKGGEVTPIDFNESFVVAISPEASYNVVELKPFLLKLSANGIYFCYEKITGAQTTYESRPLLLLKIAKKYRLPITVGVIETSAE